jgi:PAS domain S-box-containing protein
MREKVDFLNMGVGEMPLNLHKTFVVIDEITVVKDAIERVIQVQGQILIVKAGDRIVGICDSQSLLMQAGKLNQAVDYRTDFILLQEKEIPDSLSTDYAYLIVVDAKGMIAGWLDRKSVEINFLKQAYSEDVRAITTDLEAIVDSIYDEVLVVDANGTILRVSNRSIHNLWGVEPSSVIGENILELEKKGWFKPSVSRKVIEEKKKTSIIQYNRFGRRILAVGNPIFNKKQELERIVIASRDITEVTKLEEQLEEAQNLKEQYRKEVDILKKVHQGKDKTIIYQSERMKELMFSVEQVAKVDSTVTIYGDSGVGKELISFAIHQLSARAEKPFIKINCGSIPESLLESELFGYEKGAFTGALSQGKKGLFELANEGTLFLDEIGEMPLNLQVKLLRALQEREILKVGGSRAIPINIRVITATNKNLEEMVADGSFREDLFYRIHVIPLFVPSLSERTEDIEPLVYHFLEYYNKQFSTKKHFSEDALEILRSYPWPGNIRQLQNIIERAMVISRNQVITANDLASILETRKMQQRPVEVHSIVPLNQAIQYTEQQLIRMALKKYKTLTKVAEVLEVSQPTISRHYNNLRQIIGMD